jgi:glutathione S-transferase
MKLYMSPVSTTSRPVVLFCELAGIDIELVPIDLMTGEHHGEEFVALNPNRLVPVLQDGDFVLTESSAIIKYLADKVDSPLYPKDLRARARVNERMDWFNTNLYRELGYNLVYPQLFPHHKRPSDDVTTGTVAWGKDKTAAVLGLLETFVLADNPYVCGDKLTIADIFGAQLVCTAELVGQDFSKYPKAKAWIDRIKGETAWAKVNEAHDGFAAQMADKGLVSA